MMLVMRTPKVIAVMLLAVCSLAAQSRTPTAPATSRFAAAIDQTVAHGRDAVLPPHISHLLGISPREQEVPIKQFVIMGEPIRGIEISKAETNNVVIFVENRAQKESTFYLTSKRGTLRKVLSVKNGVGYGRQPTRDDREALEKEKQYWVEQLSPKQR